MKDTIRIGTCSWKYDSWRGIIYPEHGAVNHLREYSFYYDTVEVDQWFWSLFKGDQVLLPKAEAVREYAESVPDTFTFCIKVPNSITLTHHYSRGRKAPLLKNPYFLSVELMNRFLESIEILEGHIGPLIFQFEYLNKKKMPDKEAFFDLQSFRGFSTQNNQQDSGPPPLKRAAHSREYLLIIKGALSLRFPAGCRLLPSNSPFRHRLHRRRMTGNQAADPQPRLRLPSAGKGSHRADRRCHRHQGPLG